MSLMSKYFTEIPDQSVSQTNCWDAGPTLKNTFGPTMILLFGPLFETAIIF